MVVMGLLLAASSLGFLFHNWPPARIFMGDVGSAFLGYSFAVLPLIFVSHSSLPRGLGVVFAGMLPFGLLCLIRHLPSCVGCGSAKMSSMRIDHIYTSV